MLGTFKRSRVPVISALILLIVFGIALSLRNYPMMTFPSGQDVRTGKTDEEVNREIEAYVNAAVAGAKAVPTKQSQAKAKAAPAIPPKIVMYVDDDSGLRAAHKVFFEVFAPPGITLIAVASCDEALAHPQFSLTDLFLVDYQMKPVMGDVCVSRIKAARPTALVYGYSTQGVRAAFDKAGATGFIEKTPDLDGLIRVLSAILKL